MFPSLVPGYPMVGLPDHRLGLADDQKTHSEVVQPSYHHSDQNASRKPESLQDRILVRENLAVEVKRDRLVIRQGVDAEGEVLSEEIQPTSARIPH